MSIGSMIVLGYLVLGTAWGYLVVYKFPYQMLKEGERVCEVSSIGLNCLLFPLGILFRTFLYILSISKLVGEGEDGPIYEKGLGFVLESFNRCDCEDCKNKRNKKDKGHADYHSSETDCIDFILLVKNRFK